MGVGKLDEKIKISDHIRTAKCPGIAFLFVQIHLTSAQFFEKLMNSGSFHVVAFQKKNTNLTTSETQVFPLLQKVLKHLVMNI